MSTQKPLILVSNDDGINARGIVALAEALGPLGEVAVIAPDRNRSGVSHMISLHQPLRADEIRPNWWAVDGSPADCVYLGVLELLQRKPDILFSGINAGANLSFDVHYSGTVGAAVEGTLLGIPSVAVSLTDTKLNDYSCAAAFAAQVCQKVLRDGLPANTTLNVNVPPGKPSSWQMTFLGHRLFRQSIHRRDDPRGSTYYWIGGVPQDASDLPGSDCNAIVDGVISMTPLNADMTYVGGLRSIAQDWTLEDLSRVQNIEPPSDLEFWEQH